MTEAVDPFKVAVKLYNARETVRRFWGSDYDAQMDQWVPTIKKIQEERKMESPLSVAVWASESGDFDGMETLFVLAACVEAVERKSAR